MDSVPSQQFFRPALVTWIGIILIIFDVIAIGLTLYIYFVSQKLITSLEKVKDILFKDKEPNFPAARIALINKTVLTIIFSLAFIVFAIFFLKGYQWPFDTHKIKNYGSSLSDVLVHRREQKEEEFLWILPKILSLEMALENSD